MPLPIAAITAGLNLASSLFGKKDKGGGGGGGSNLLELAMPGMVQGGFGLLGSLLSGKAQDKAMKQEFEMYKKKGAEQEKRLLKYLKPEQPRYGIEKDLPTIDPAFKKIILGRMAETFGGERLGKWGVDPAALLAGIGGGSSSAAPPEGTFGGQRIPGDIADRVIGKYGMKRGKAMMD